MTLSLLREPAALTTLALFAFTVPGPATTQLSFKNTSPDEAPAPSHLEAVAFDAARGRLVVFGGSRQPTPNTWADSDETWEWDGARWHRMPPPPSDVGARRGHAFGYDPTTQRIVMVGGVRAKPGTKDDEPLDDTWFYDGRTWTRGPSAPLMSGHHTIHAGNGNGLLLLGYSGREAYHPRRLTMWRLTPNGWTFVDSAGPMMASHVRAAYDPKRGVLVVPVLNDSTTRVWEWNGRTWRSQAAAGPTRRTRHMLTFDAKAGHTLLFGGRDETSRNPVGDAWSWDGQRWTALTTDATWPGSRASATLVSGDRSGQLLLFGGVVPQRGIVADLWIRSASGWSQSIAAQGATPLFTSVKGAFIGVSVRDLEASVRWYEEKFGLEVIMRPPKIEKSTAVILSGGGLTVELMHHEDAVPLSTAAPTINRNFLVHGIFKAGIVVDEFDKVIAGLRARGVPIAIGPFAATAEQPANAIIRDNSGNYIQFFGAR